MSDKIPLIVVGDAPTQPSGLGRIARDLCLRIHQHLGGEVDLVQIGIQAAEGSNPWAGPYPLLTFSYGEGRQGAVPLYRTLKRLSDQGRAGVVLVLWDAGFSHELLQVTREFTGWEFWIYPPVDAVNEYGVFGGPAGEVVERADRVLAYGAWAQAVLHEIRAYGHPERARVEALPLGIDDLWEPSTVLQPFGKGIGCVATNTTRKDLALYFSVIAKLLNRGHQVKAWLVTDTMVKGWSIPELRRVYQIPKGTLTVFTNGHNLSDEQVRELYQQTSVTLAVGAGEGFGYPIVESLACGTPVVHGNYAGGAALASHLVEPAMFRVEGVFALRRPIFRARDWADRVEQVWSNRATDHREDYAAVGQRFRWSRIWPSWEDWLRRGLREFRERQQAAAGVL